MSKFLGSIEGIWDGNPAKIKYISIGGANMQFQNSGLGDLRNWFELFLGRIMQPLVKNMQQHAWLQLWLIFHGHGHGLVGLSEI